MIQSKLQTQLRGEDTSRGDPRMVKGEVRPGFLGTCKFSAEKLGLSLQGYSIGTPCK